MVGYGTTQAGQQDAITNVQQDIDNVKGIMTENIERVLERGERIDLLVDKTDRLGVGAHDFRMRSRGLKRQMWWKNMKLMVLLGVVVVFLIYLFVGFGCGLPGMFAPVVLGGEILTSGRVVTVCGQVEGLTAMHDGHSRRYGLETVNTRSELTDIHSPILLGRSGERARGLLNLLIRRQDFVC